MQLSQVLSDLMYSRNLSAYRMSKETGISNRLIGYWKKGEKLPSAENLITLATYFGTSVDFIHNCSEQDKKPELSIFSANSDENIIAK